MQALVGVLAAPIAVVPASHTSHKSILLKFLLPLAKGSWSHPRPVYERFSALLPIHGDNKLPWTRINCYPSLENGRLAVELLNTAT